MVYWVVIGPYLEREAVESAISAIPGVEFVRTTGDLDVGITASVVLTGGRALEFAGVTMDAFGAGGKVHVSRVDDLGALTTGCPIGEMATRAGQSWSYSFDLDRDGRMSNLMGAPLDGIRNAIDRYEDLRRLFENAPRCPDKARVDTPADFPWQLFYCVKFVRAGEQVPLRDLDCRPMRSGQGATAWR